ncbi:MAG TPA: hypothetical protein PKM35_06430 [Holophaga sp.]|nr:hypothetical protein [Holophaga sp.]HPS66611.1 hypothetical protein [Holophaga sp.]
MAEQGYPSGIRIPDLTGMQGDACFSSFLSLSSLFSTSVKACSTRMQGMKGIKAIEAKALAQSFIQVHPLVEVLA